MSLGPARRGQPMRTELSLSGLLALHAPSGCATLEPPTPRACGNGVVDEASEDCDPFPQKADADGHRCREPGAVGACHFECGTKDGVKLQCPGGYGCGHDSICRRASGSFGDSIASLDSPAVDPALYSGDF